MSASPTATTPTQAQPRSRTTVAAAVVALLLIGALGAWLLAPSLLIPADRIVGWQLEGYPGRVTDASASGTDITVFIDQWPEALEPGDGSWLDQRVIETPFTVTITLHTTDAFASLPGPRGWYDTGGWVTVHLAGPLGGRSLFDGSGFPPQPRPLP